MKTDVLICTLSWEERYILGLEKNIKKYTPKTIIIIRYTSNAEWKKANWEKSKALSLSQDIIELCIDKFDHKNNWLTLKEGIAEYCKNKNVLVDITTMPRETIWLTLFNCKLNNCSTSYIYYKPQKYSDEWLSRDPGKPRLIYKMSGIAKFGVPTVLVVTGGYDIQRLDSLISNFEPKYTILFLLAVERAASIPAIPPPITSTSGLLSSCFSSKGV